MGLFSKRVRWCATGLTASLVVSLLSTSLASAQVPPVTSSGLAPTAGQAAPSARSATVSPDLTSVGGGLTSVAPSRILDTRTGNGAPRAAVRRRPDAK